MLYYQVNRLFQKYTINHLFRFTHSEPTPKVLFPLNSRRILKVSGSDAPEFLQGLITNDMRHFEEGAKSMYALFLNNKGRILYDTLIHKWEGDDSFLIECDSKVIGNMEKHLKIFKLKRKVNFKDMSDALKLWVFIAPPDCIPDLKVDPGSSINVYKDPRLADLGYRILASTSMGKQQLNETIGTDIVIPDIEDGYKYLRYKLGVGEGADDLPPATVFPLEANCDYLHGVSFHKGCYLGQELLARVHHTGVVRKRILPIKLSAEDTSLLNTDTAIVDGEKNKEVGKLKGVIHEYGIGLLRIKEALEAKQLKIGELTVEVAKPTWWPVEAPKEKVTKTEVTTL